MEDDATVVDNDALVRETARYYGFSDEDAFAARDLLAFNDRDLAVRFNGLAHFSRTYGVNIKDLAALIVETGSGVEPWKPDDRTSSEDWARIDEEIRRRAPGGGHWAETILSLVNELEELRHDS
jgi:aryl-alcohol dehydrogenase-like predicted oxidoreductase